MDPDDERPATKIARCDQGVDAGAEVHPEADSSVNWTKTDLQAIVSEFARQIRESKGQVVALLGDIAARPDGVFTRNTVATKDSACKHCCGRWQELIGEESPSELADDSLEDGSQIPFPRPGHLLHCDL